MTFGIGHNGGPTTEGGRTWRQHCWKKARAELVPHLPIEIVRQRVARAKELGLPYKTYASVRASTGRDVIGFLFSSNALRAFHQKEKLAQDVFVHDKLPLSVCATGCQLLPRSARICSGQRHGAKRRPSFGQARRGINRPATYAAPGQPGFQRPFS